MGLFDFFRQKKIKQTDSTDSPSENARTINIKYSIGWKDNIASEMRDFDKLSCCIGRPLCRKLVELNKIYTRQDIETISMKLGYDAYDHIGGDSNCSCEWKINVESNITENDTISLLSKTDIVINIKTLFSGIDFDFIDLIYFKDENEKDDFVKNIDLLLVNLEIGNDTKYTEFIEKIVKFEESDSGDHIDFVREIFLFDDYLVKDINGKKIIEKANTKKKIGLEKISDYYSALKFATRNIQRKVERQNSDFEDEDAIINNTLNSSDLFNYIRIETLNFVGQTYAASGNVKKSEMYFNRILTEKDQFQLSPETVGKFIREVGEYYYKVSDYKNALKYFEIGLIKNPNLGVKKRIIELKELLNKK